jgi:hypothetical protein
VTTTVLYILSLVSIPSNSSFIALSVVIEPLQGDRVDPRYVAAQIVMQDVAFSWRSLLEPASRSRARASSVLRQLGSALLRFYRISCQLLPPHDPRLDWHLVRREAEGPLPAPRHAVVLEESLPGLIGAPTLGRALALARRVSAGFLVLGLSGKTFS